MPTTHSHTIKEVPRPSIPSKQRHLKTYIWTSMVRYAFRYAKVPLNMWKFWVSNAKGLLSKFSPSSMLVICFLDQTWVMPKIRSNQNVWSKVLLMDCNYHYSKNTLSINMIIRSGINTFTNAKKKPCILNLVFSSTIRLL